jgi:acetyl esterase/lipase
MAPERIRYGDDASQWADLYRPEGPSRGVVVVIHGGFWRVRYDTSLGTPLAEDLVARGWTAWNLEYRRVGNGGGWPTTCDDVAAGIDRLADVPGLDLSGPVVTLGHSAGGHLATWAASRGRSERWHPVRVGVTGVVSQAGVLDLRRCDAEQLGAGAVRDFLGQPPGPEHDSADPQRQIPLDVPVRCVHGRDDDVVPLHVSEAYVAAARAAGARAELHVVDGDHFTVIDTASPAWAWTVEQLVSL